MLSNAFESHLLDDQNNFKRRKQTFSEEFENDFDPQAIHHPTAMKPEQREREID